MTSSSALLGTALVCLAGLAGCAGEPDPSPPDAEAPSVDPAAAPSPAPSPGSPADSPFELAGLYVYLADAPSFSPCGTDAVLPVWQDSASLELERGYLALGGARRPAGAPARVRVLGRVQERPAMEGPPRPHLVVDSVLELAAEGVCPEGRRAAPLVGTDWRLVGTPAPAAGTEERGAWLLLEDDPERVRGHTGCRPFGGRYAWTGTRLRFQALTASPGDCPGEALHRAVLEGLAAAGSYRIRGDTLELLGEPGPVLTLAARR